MTLLLSERVRLEPWQKRHMKQSLAILTGSRDKALFDFTNMPYPYKRKHGLDFLKRLKKGKKEKTDIVFAIVLPKDDALIGVCGIHKIDKKNHCAEMGFWIAQQHRGKGYATEAAQLVIDYGFTTYKLNRLEIRCSTLNAASQNVIKKLGGIYEGIHRKEKYSPIRKGYHDIEVYSILRQEWIKKGENK